MRLAAGDRFDSGDEKVRLRRSVQRGHRRGGRQPSGRSFPPSIPLVVYRLDGRAYRSAASSWRGPHRVSVMGLTLMAFAFVDRSAPQLSPRAAGRTGENSAQSHGPSPPAPRNARHHHRGHHRWRLSRPPEAAVAGTAYAFVLGDPSCIGRSSYRICRRSIRRLRGDGRSNRDHHRRRLTDRLDPHHGASAGRKLSPWSTRRN